MASGPSVIPATKLHIPSVRAGIVSRDELVELLARGRSGKLTLLNAPAGFGKTTLLAQWCASASEERSFAWLSLDAADNDPVRFWTCAIDALDGLAPGTGARAREALGASSYWSWTTTTSFATHRCTVRWSYWWTTCRRTSTSPSRRAWTRPSRLRDRGPAGS